MKKNTYLKLIAFSMLLVGLSLASCKDDPVTDDDTEENTEIDFSDLGDDYAEIASPTYSSQWGVHNVHDPMIRKVGDSYYCYSTDVCYGNSVRSGLQIRSSKNLVTWDFEGWVFTGLPDYGVAWIEENTSYTGADALWAPAFYEYNGEYRLYYSLPGSGGTWVADIGLATSSSPESGWSDQGVLVGSTSYSASKPNCIDPTVVVTPDNEHWMAYGSGNMIKIVQLNPETGMQLTANDYGTVIAKRGYTDGTINGNIEGPELIYNEETEYYYLFLAYDALGTKYNTRVGRSKNVSGPYLDMFGSSMASTTDNYPMLTDSYRFKGHSGYQGVSHCTVFQDDDGQWYHASQARPSVNAYLMNLHVREMFWTEDGWPIVSPERYAGHASYSITQDGIAGKWEFIDFAYTLVPGYDQPTANVSTSDYLELNEDGTIDDGTDTWTYSYPWLSLTLNGETTDVHISVGRDWERSTDSTLVFAGLKADGMSLWGKKID